MFTDRNTCAVERDFAARLHQFLRRNATVELQTLNRSMHFSQPHIHAFEQAKIGNWPGARKPGQWFTSIGYTARSRIPASITSCAPNGNGIREASHDKSIDTLDLCMLTFAWGEMTVRNAKGVLTRFELGE